LRYYPSFDAVASLRENAALQHRLIVLPRKVPGRIHFTNSDHLFFVQLYGRFSSVLQAMTTCAMKKCHCNIHFLTGSD